MATIKEDYVSFETAKLLKDKGFSENTVCKYADVGGITEKYYDDYRERVLRFNLEYGYLIEPPIEPKDQYEIIGDTISAPTLQMAMKWLREVHNLFIEIMVGESEGKTWYDYDILPINGKFIYWKKLEVLPPTVECNTPEEAIEVGLKYCLENLI